MSVWEGRENLPDILCDIQHNLDRRVVAVEDLYKIWFYSWNHRRI